MENVSLQLKAIGRCVKINVLYECNISVALGCSRLGGGLVIKIDVSHHYYVPQQRQEHSIYHSLKLRMYFHNFPEALKAYIRHFEHFK